MNRKLGQVIKAIVFAVPFALPGIALAQSAAGSSPTNDTTANQPDTAKPPAQDNANKGVDQNNLGSPNANGTLDQNQADKQNAGSLGTGSEDASGTSNSDHQSQPARRQPRHQRLVGLE